MPPKSPGTSYTGKPVRKLKLPTIGQRKAKSLVEQYFYVLLAVAFPSLAILGKAGGFSTYNALIVAAWITALIWFTRQLRGYFAAKAMNENERTGPPRKAPWPLPRGMKPMIGPQWPVRPGSRPVWPKLSGPEPATAAAEASSPPPAVGPSAVPSPPSQTSGATPPENQRRFVYERPTLPDRTPKLPNNWLNPNKKAKNKKPKR